MKIVTFNVNGIRSAINKGFTTWVRSNDFDIICLQEVKAMRADVDLRELEADGYNIYWYAAQKKGYSGVAILSKRPAKQVFYGQGTEQSDFEGRVIRADFEDCTVISAYFPSGTSGEERQAYKYIWLDDFYQYINDLRSEIRRPVIVCGDYNIAHEEIDIHSPKTNMKSSGFLPEERAWMTKFLSEDWIDTFRFLHPTVQKYSWWTFRANARANNKGWRIDYITIPYSYSNLVIGAEMLNDVVMSDHCPVSVNLAL